nr:hypothetical protein [Streptomyces sp. yr375]
MNGRKPRGSWKGGASTVFGERYASCAERSDRPVHEPTDETTDEITDAACAYCGVGCNPTPHVQDNEIVEVTSPHDNPVAHGNRSAKGRFGYQHVQNRG